MFYATEIEHNVSFWCNVSDIIASKSMYLL
jgi:hypothetical protein